MKVVDTPIKLKLRHMAYQVDFDHPVQKGDLIAGTKDRHYQVDLSEDVLNRYAVRTIVITDLQGNQTQIVQRVHFVRIVWVDAVTGLPIIPLESVDWQTLNTKSIWNAVSIPQIDGYQAIITDTDTGQQLISIDKQTPSATNNQTINVIYQAKTGQRIINYVDENDNVIGTQTVTGDINTMVPVKLNLPKTGSWPTKTISLTALRSRPPISQLTFWLFIGWLRKHHSCARLRGRSTLEIR
ncbi:hypothetical protein LX03_00405 [Limosilactobacillus mucosae]|uniref:Mub B2-like domain-containing protein n=1 Tax=Limosilactobacillus mucosae TaxID=97478 RepID=A0A099YDT7_LIMMU|nr:hypothetical protein LX03_00405 [Limosilactobacillus mucosae]